MAGERTLSGFAAERSASLTRFAYLLCGDRGRAEDLVQDAFLALYRRYGDSLPLAAPVAYARKAILHRHIGLARRRASSEVPMDRLPDSSIPPPGVPAEDAVWQMLADLPARQRAVLVSRYYLDLPDIEIAEMLGCRPGTVRRLAARVFQALRDGHDLTEERP